jgi:regulator of nucleoside diphosphate kinase
MTDDKAPSRPPVHMIEAEADNLARLAASVEDRMPQVSELLLEEIARATIHSEASIPPDVVTMLATVQFADASSGRNYSYQLVYPKDADIAAGRISILTPVGAGLIGLREGQSILWPDRDGRERKLTIIKVSGVPKAA